MTCCKFWTQERCTRSECMVIFKNLRKRIISRVTVFKITQLFLASAGMGIHVFQPSYVTMVDSTLVPAVLGAYIIISGVLFVGHLLNCGAPTRLDVTFSIVAAFGYGWCMSAIMDSIKIERDTTSWSFLLGKGIMCFAALAIHLLELLQIVITSDKRPSTLRSTVPSQLISDSEILQPV